MRSLRATLLLLGAALTGGRLQAAEPADPRTDLERLELALAEAVDRVSSPSAFPMPSGSCRGYRIQGLGAVFVLPPRALRSEGGVFVFHAGDAPPAPGGRPAPRGRARLVDPREQQMRLIEAQVEAFQREAERSREEAERALEQLERQIRIKIGPPGGPSLAAVRVALPETAAPPEAPGAPVAPQSPPAPEAPIAADAPATVAPPPAPWRYWFQSERPEDQRPAAQIVADVRAAVTEALEAQGATLTILRPEELVVTAVDFVTGPAFATSGRAERTLVIRVHKKDLDERRAGKIGAEELRGRIEYAEY